MQRRLNQNPYDFQRLNYSAPNPNSPTPELEFSSTLKIDISSLIDCLLGDVVAKAVGPASGHKGKNNVRIHGSFRCRGDVEIIFLPK